jgi:hypothetical protein
LLRFQKDSTSSCVSLSYAYLDVSGWYKGRDMDRLPAGCGDGTVECSCHRLGTGTRWRLPSSLGEK